MLWLKPNALINKLQLPYFDAVQILASSSKSESKAIFNKVLKGEDFNVSRLCAQDIMDYCKSDRKDGN